MDIMKKYPSTIIVSFVGLGVTMIFGAWWSVSLVSAYVKYHPSANGEINPACGTTGGSCSSGALIGILVFFSMSPSPLETIYLTIAFAGFFITEVIKNVIHTTISGIFGSYYVPLPISSWWC
jgi:Plasma-membrane choline transporter